ncbi:hypothetical protein L7F22_062103 [Adiantum nelumboides]|nr:hypothetical protein [Adiantum nelumboides]
MRHYSTSPDGKNLPPACDAFDDKNFSTLASAAYGKRLMAAMRDESLLLKSISIQSLQAELILEDYERLKRHMKGEQDEGCEEECAGGNGRDHPDVVPQDPAIESRREILLDVMLAAVLDTNSEVQIINDNITARDKFLKGTDTIAIAAEWTLAELLVNLEVWKKAQEEIDRVVGRERAVEDEDVEELPYVQPVVKQTF